MDPTEILVVRFHFGGEFVRIGPNLDYVGGDDALSEIERDKLSLQEVIGFVKDHIEYKQTMKIYFQIPGKELADGLIFLNDDSKCLMMADYISVGGVADVNIEYHGEEDSADSSSGSDFEKEVLDVSDSDEAPAAVISAEPAEGDTDVFITDKAGVVTYVVSSPLKKQVNRRRPVLLESDADDDSGEDSDIAVVNPTQGMASQVINPTQEMPAVGSSSGHQQQHVAAVASHDGEAEPLLLTGANSEDDDSGEDSESDVEYVPHTDDSGEDSDITTSTLPHPSSLTHTHNIHSANLDTA